MPPQDDNASIAATLATGMRELVGSADPVDIVGFSLGGVVGAHLAAFHPALVRRLIIVGTGGLGTPLGAIKLRRVRGLEDADRRIALRDNLLSLMLYNPASVDELALYLQVTNGLRGRLDPSPLVLPDKLLQILPHVSVQVDAIWGELDQPHPDPALQESVLRRLHPDMDFRVIGNAGHWAMYENPAEFNSTVLELLGRPLRPIKEDSHEDS
jgi:pimeloyl-ACP methyl ester carboxylesterase